MEFVRTIDSRFEKYDETGKKKNHLHSLLLIVIILTQSLQLIAAWPSTIDDFVAWARKKL